MRFKVPLFLFIIISTITNCRIIRKIQFPEEDKEFVKMCREKWTMKELENKTTIELLHLDSKGRYDSRSWPNLFIGIDSKNDTIGIIENFTSKEFKRGEKLTFEPFDYGIDIERGFLRPVFKVQKKKKRNKLYCSIQTLYYAKLIE